MPKRKASRRPSPRPSPERQARRADRQATRRKLAIVNDLTNTIPGVQSGSSPGLLTKAREAATKYTAPSRETWFTRFAAKNAEAATELHALVVDWILGGEMRDHYPTLSHLHRFVDHEVTRVERQSFVKWVRSVEATL